MAITGRSSLRLNIELPTTKIPQLFLRPWIVYGAVRAHDIAAGSQGDSQTALQLHQSQANLRDTDRSDEHRSHGQRRSWVMNVKSRKIAEGTRRKARTKGARPSRGLVPVASSDWNLPAIRVNLRVVAPEAQVAEYDDRFAEGVR